METIPISSIKLSYDKHVVLQFLNGLNYNDLPPLLVDDNYNLIDNYDIYFCYLIQRKNSIPVIVSNALDDFYLNDVKYFSYTYPVYFPIPRF